MQGILIQQQQFTQQLMRIISKEFEPSEGLELELKHAMESFFIEIKQLEYEMKESIGKYCNNCAKYKQSIIDEFHDAQHDQWKHRYDELNTEFLILKACNQQIELQKAELQQKLIDQRTKYEELNRQKKEDKDNYRQQYEALKKKAQDKIHRLKDKVVLFQTQLQTYAIESEHLRIIASEDKVNSPQMPSTIKFKLKAILKEVHQLRNLSNTLLLENSKIIMQAKEQLQILNFKKDIQGTIIRRNNTPPEPAKIKQYYSQSQSIQNSPDRKLKTEKPNMIRKLNVTRSSISKNLLAEFDASAQITKFIKQYYNADQQLRNSTGFHTKLF
ncbi:unnamed protein product [Paramecium octaurelia]|uniref:Uncharacterized protein n=1 Tax=Paramecium octaurelia TaxID=43137 RepID=A0A8S1U563_PAROT|nr:unnamed protein product [Paramecium octaurelia]